MHRERVCLCLCVAEPLPARVRAVVLPTHAPPGRDVPVAAPMDIDQVPPAVEPAGIEMREGRRVSLLGAVDAGAPDMQPLVEGRAGGGVGAGAAAAAVRARAWRVSSEAPLRPVPPPPPDCACAELVRAPAASVNTKYQTTCNTGQTVSQVYLGFGIWYMVENFH